MDVLMLLKQAITDCGARAQRQDIAMHIKKEADRRFGTTWHCVVGKKCVSLTEGRHCFAYQTGVVADSG